MESGIAFTKLNETFWHCAHFDLCGRRISKNLKSFKCTVI